MPEFSRATFRDMHEHVVMVKIFALPEGLACVVSWALPEPGLRTFNPTPSETESIRRALPYAQFLREHIGALRVAVGLDEGVEWNPVWGTLTD